MARSKKPQEGVGGGYSALPHMVMDGAAYQALSHPSRSLLNEIVRQHNGRNNGHMQLSTMYLRKRGWTSADVVDRAKKELINSGLAIKTKLGGLNAGPDQWAVTWLSITDFTGLTEVTAATYMPGKWRSADPMPTIKKHEAPSVLRNSAVPPNGLAKTSTVPSNGPKKAIFDVSTVPSNGNNVFMPVKGVEKRVVGKPRVRPDHHRHDGPEYVDALTASEAHSGVIHGAVSKR